MAEPENLTTRQAKAIPILIAAKSYEEGVFVGVGHGGIESIAFGLLVASGLVGALSVTSDAPLDAQVMAAATLNAPAVVRLSGVVERTCMIAFHTAMSLQSSGPCGISASSRSWAREPAPSVLSCWPW